MRTITRHILYWTSALCYTGFIFYMSSLSHPPVPQQWFNYDKITHTLEYTLLAILWSLVANLYQHAKLSPNTIRKKFILIWLACCLYGASDEIHQSMVPERDCSAKDWIADITGSGLGCLWMYKRRKKL